MLRIAINNLVKIFIFYRRSLVLSSQYYSLEKFITSLRVHISYCLSTSNIHAILIECNDISSIGYISVEYNFKSTKNQNYNRSEREREREHTSSPGALPSHALLQILASPNPSYNTGAGNFILILLPWQGEEEGWKERGGGGWPGHIIKAAWKQYKTIKGSYHNRAVQPARYCIWQKRGGCGSHTREPTYSDRGEVAGGRSVV